MPTEMIAGRKSLNIVCSPVLLYRVPLLVFPASGPLQENENAIRKGQLQLRRQQEVAFFLDNVGWLRPLSLRIHPCQPRSEQKRPCSPPACWCQPSCWTCPWWQVRSSC